MRHPMILAGVLILLAGCINLGEGTRHRVRLYTLQPTVSAAESRFGLAGQSVGVGPVYLPDYLQRTQVITLDTPNEYRLAEFGKWAEPLEENILRVTAENLFRLLESERILTFPWRSGRKPDYLIRMDIRRFEAVTGDAAHLTVQWTIEPQESEKAPRSGLFQGKSPLQGEGTDAVVAAMSRTLGDFSRRMAEELARFEEQGKAGS
jgi:hypothetical protein